MLQKTNAVRSWCARTGARAALMALATAVLGVAQVVAGDLAFNMDAALNGRYVWRGVTLVSAPVLQPNLFVTSTAGRGVLVAGAMPTIELRSVQGTALSLTADRNDWLTEVDYWAEYRVPAGRAALAGGMVAVTFPNRAGVTSGSNTAELYARAAWNAPFSPSLTAYYDVDHVRGTYLEASLSRSYPLTKRATAVISALGGYSAGQAIDRHGRDGANFCRDGLTHLDLAIALPHQFDRLVMSPVLHLVHGHDAFTRVIALDQQRHNKIWAGMSVSWSAPILLGHAQKSK